MGKMVCILHHIFLRTVSVNLNVYSNFIESLISIQLSHNWL